MAERELKYVITADDSPFKKTLENVIAMSKKSGNEVATIAESGARQEIEAKQKVIDKVIELGKKSKEVAFEIASNPDPIVNWEPQLSAMEQLHESMLQLNAEEQRLSDAFSNGSISNTEFAASIDEIKKKQEQLHNQMAQAKEGEFINWDQQTAEVKEHIDSINSLTEQLDKLKDRQKDMPIGDELNAVNQQIQALEEEIKRAANAGKTGFDAMGFAIKESVVAVPKLETQLRAVVDEMARMRVAGKVDTTEYTELTKKAAELKKAIKDVNMEIDSGASRTGNLDNAIRSVQTLTAAYSIAQSASMMLGANNEDLQKQLMKVAAAMSLLQGLQTIQNELKRADSIFTAAQTAAQRAYAIAVGTSTGAMKVFRIALASTGVGLLVIALGSLIANFDKVTAAVNKFLPAGKSVQRMFDNIKNYAMGVGDTVLKFIAKPFEAITALLSGDLAGFKTALKEGLSFKANFENSFQEQEIRNLAKHNAKLTSMDIEAKERELERAKNRGEKVAQAEIDLQKRKLSIMKKGSEEYLEQQKKIEDMEDAMYKEANKKVSTRAADAEANKRQSLLDKLDDMNTEYLRKSMSKDEQEYQSIVDKYAKMRREIEQFNASVKKGERIDLKGFDKQAEVAIADVIYRQDTSKEIAALEGQRKLYENFERAKKEIGEKYAIERYENEIDLSKTYGQLIAESIADLQGKELTGAEKERLQELEALQKDHRTNMRSDEEKSLIAALQLAQTYEDKKAAILKEYADAEIALGDKITEAKKSILDKGRAEDLKALDKNLLEELASYKSFFDNLADLSGEKLANAASALESDIADLVSKNPELKEFADLLIKKIAGAKTAKTAADFANMADALSYMADSLGDVDNGFTAALRSASNLASQVSSMKVDMEAFSIAMKNGNTMGGIASGLGIIGAGFNIMQSINGFLDRTTKADEQRIHNAELQLQATEGLTRALERQLKIANEAYGTEKIREYTKAIEDSIAVQDKAADALKNRYILTGDAEIDGLVEKVNKGERLKKFKLWGDSEREVWRGVSGGLQKVTTDIDELQRLLDNGLLDDQTAKIAQNFINAHDAIIQAERAITEQRTGVAFDSLADDLFNAASDGIDAVGKSFESTMKKAILSSLRTGAYAKAMEKFYKDFDEASKDGFTQSEIDQLRVDYEKIAKDQMESINKMAEVTGIDLTGEEKKKDTLSKNIQGITETTANRLEGELGGLRLAQLQLLEVTSGQTSIMQQHMGYAFQNLQAALAIQSNTFRTANNTDALGDIKKAIIDLNSKVVNTDALRRGAG